MCDGSEFLDSLCYFIKFIILDISLGNLIGILHLLLSTYGFLNYKARRLNKFLHLLSPYHKIGKELFGHPCLNTTNNPQSPLP